MTPTLSEEATFQLLIKYNAVIFDKRIGLDACIEWIEKDAYLETAFSKMRNIEPIATGIVTVPVRFKSKPDVYMETAILCWSNGVVIVLRPQDTDDITYLCYTKPEKVSIYAPTLQAKAEFEEETPAEQES